MTKNTLAAIRAFNRVWAPIADEQAHFAAADHAFDGGEWSDAESARITTRLQLQTMGRVARRFGLSLHELCYALAEYEHEQHRCMVEHAACNAEERGGSKFAL